jgi:polar amino acid transport system substrate-binding protein
MRKIIISLHGVMVHIGTMNPLVLFFCLVMTFCTACPAGGETLIVASDEWCPFNCVPKSPQEGYAVDILRAVFEPAGIAVEYRVMGWERAVEEARRGNVSAVIGAVRGEVEGFVLPEEEIGVDFFAFFVKEGDPWKYREPASLLGRRLGVPAGYLLTPSIQSFSDAHKTEIDIYRAGREQPTRHNLRLLMGGRLDVVADDAQVVLYLAHSMNLPEAIEYAGFDGDHTRLYVAFSPVRQESPRYVALFDKGIRGLRETGRLDEILGRYGLIDWRRRFKEVP